MSRQAGRGGSGSALLVEIEVARRLLLEPETVVLRRLLQEVRGLLEHVLLVLELRILDRLEAAWRRGAESRLRLGLNRLERFRNVGRVQRIEALVLEFELRLVERFRLLIRL